MDSRAPINTADSQLPTKLSRRQLFRRLSVYAVAPLGFSLYASQIEPFWPEFHEIDIPVRNLPKSFEGFRVAQLTDLHAGRTPFGYLQRVVKKVLALKPDLVAVTGDLTHHSGNWINPVADLLGSLTDLAPVLMSYGNHDFGIYRDDDQTADRDLPTKLRAALEKQNITVLRNENFSIHHSDGRLCFTGLDDIWFGEFDAGKAFAGINPDEPVIALTHNPDTAERVDKHQPSLILSGHTHGGQFRLPLVGALYLNTVNTQWDQGLFQLRNAPLYVCRGIGYIQRVRFMCRPEIPIFRLTRA